MDVARSWDPRCGEERLARLGVGVLIWEKLHDIGAADGVEEDGELGRITTNEVVRRLRVAGCAGLGWRFDGTVSDCGHGMTRGKTDPSD